MEEGESHRTPSLTPETKDEGDKICAIKTGH